YLKAGESRAFQLEFGTLTEADEVKALERKASQPVFVDHYSAFDKKC
ncbi:MAG: hypothetical protein GX117_01845, partial [Candidatus Hydrogenedentes bacterium]|nr:hypothetical protein [Candidatus Hydrogenedentota bacterium]